MQKVYMIYFQSIKFQWYGKSWFTTRCGVWTPVECLMLLIGLLAKSTFPRSGDQCFIINLIQNFLWLCLIGQETENRIAFLYFPCIWLAGKGVVPSLTTFLQEIFSLTSHPAILIGLCIMENFTLLSYKLSGKPNDYEKV